MGLVGKFGSLVTFNGIGNLLAQVRPVVIYFGFYEKIRRRRFGSLGQQVGVKMTDKNQQSCKNDRNDSGGSHLCTVTPANKIKQMLVKLGGGIHIAGVSGVG